MTTILALYYGSLFFGMQAQLLYKKKLWISSFLTIFALALNVILSILLTPLYGGFGSAVSTLVSGVISGGIGFAIGQRHYAIGWEYPKVCTLLGLLFGSGLLLVALRLTGASYAVLLPLKLSIVAAYTLAGIRYGVITKENMRAFSSSLQSIFSRQRT